MEKGIISGCQFLTSPDQLLTCKKFSTNLNDFETFWTIVNHFLYLGLFQTILCYLVLSWAISGYLLLSPAIPCYLRLYQDISDCLLHFQPLSINKFFDPNTPSMRKVDNGEKRRRKKKEREKNGGNSGPLTSLPVDRLNGDRLQCQSSCQKDKMKLDLLGLT